MISSELLAVAYGLASAASWGAGDFSGGFASRRSNVYSVVLLSQMVGAVLLLLLALLFQEQIPPFVNLIFGGIAGICGMVGLVALYRGLAHGRMGIVAPVAAVTTAVLPVLVSLFTEGLPSPLQTVGFAVALAAVWLLSSGSSHAKIQLNELGYALTAGLGFGLFFIFIDHVSDVAILWPLVAARTASLLFLLAFVTLRGQLQAPNWSQIVVIALAGIFDAGGNAFFALATQVGRLDIAAVLSSLYPASTVILAWFILKERLVRQQWLGVAAALAALLFIAA